MFGRSLARTSSVLRPFSRTAARPIASFAAASTSRASRWSPLFAAAAVGAAGVYAMSGDQLQLDCSSCCSYDKLRKDITDAIDREDERRNDGTSIGPTLVRLAWHASGTYSVKDKTGGSNGATMRFSPECDWGANAGLKLAREFLEPLKAKYPHVSYADLWTLAGVVAIENMGGPKIPWRHGRTDATEPTRVPDGRLPAADSGSRQKDAAHIREVFGRQGFTDREMVALIGCHAVGRCHTDASGYWGPWTNAETTFSNDYFRLLLEESWTLKTTHMGKVSTSTVLIKIS